MPSTPRSAAFEPRWPKTVGTPQCPSPPQTTRNPLGHGEGQLLAGGTAEDVDDLDLFVTLHHVGRREGETVRGESIR